MKYNKISINKLLVSEMGGGRREAVMEQVLMFKKIWLIAAQHYQIEQDPLIHLETGHTKPSGMSTLT